MEFMIGQRVIYQNVICVVCAPETEDRFENTWMEGVWIDNPKVGYKHSVSVDNLKALPLGQL